MRWGEAFATPHFEATLRQLKIDASGQLNIPWPGAFRYLQSRDLPESGHSDEETVRDSEIGVVEDVAHLGADPGSNPLGEVDGLDER